MLAILAANLPSYSSCELSVTVQLKHNFSRERQADVDSNLHTAEPDWFTASVDTVLVESFVLYHFVFLGEVSPVLSVCLPQTTASFSFFFSFCLVIFVVENQLQAFSFVAEKQLHQLTAR